MGTLNPNLLSKHTSLILNEAAKIMPTLGKRLLMPEIVLLSLIRTPDTSARRILDKVAQERGFKLSDLDQAAVAQLNAREGRPADFVFVLDNGGKVELSDELLQTIDEALTIAQASDEVWIGTEHLLSALAQRGVSERIVGTRLLGVQPLAGDGGRGWDRTSDPYDVNVVLSR